jgi:hypothetical protein
MKTAAIVLGLALCVCAGAAAAAQRASLHLVAVAPLTVRGSGFVPGEKVKLLATGSRIVATVVRTGPHGGFQVRLPLGVSACSAFAVQAFGARGDRALLDRTSTACDPDPGTS